MNCGQAKELLVDLVYGELGEAGSAGVEAHLSACPACREEARKMRLARALLARGRAGEPAAAPALPPAAASAAGERLAGRAWRPWGRGVFSVAVAAAAAVLIGLPVWLLHRTSPPGLLAQERGPVEIKRVGVSLTILSQPENWPGSFEWSAEQQGQQRRHINAPADQVTMQMPEQVDLGGQMENVQTMMPMRSHSWPGLALVRDQRVVRHLGKGRTSVRFTGVPSGILADSVRLRGLSDPTALTILEQDYQYDLASAGAVLKRYVDKPIGVVFKHTGQTVQGKLLSFDGRTLVIQPDKEGPRNIDRWQVKAITFEKLPLGLLTQPTLVWDLDNRGAAEQQFEVAYLTYGLNWRADYVLKLRLAGGEAKAFQVQDTADIVGYATVANQSGVSYEDAQLKLLAGDVNLIRPSQDLDVYTVLRFSQSGVGGGQPQFQEKSFFEYHLYTLTRPTSIRSAETKQIEFLTAAGVRMKRGYLYDPHSGNATAVRVVSEFKNSQANHLGKPLPKGVVRLYAPDPDGVSQYVAQQTIDHTPVNEKVRVLWGYAFDLAASFKQTGYQRSGNDHHLTWEYDLRNHKAYDVTVTVLAHVDRSTYKAACNYPWHVREVGLVEIDVPVKADSAVKVTFSHSFNQSSGGGLQSPHDRKDQ